MIVIGSTGKATLYGCPELRTAGRAGSIGRRRGPVKEKWRAERKITASS